MPNQKRKIAVFVGSLRKESYNLKMAKALLKLAPESLELELVEIGHLPLYNQDLDENPPREWEELRKQVRGADGVLFVTPEYNRSVPGVLKNAIDIASRPYGKNAWDGKPGGVVSVSPGALGAFGANQHLRQTLVFVNVPVLQQPEAYIGSAAKIFDEQGELVAEATRTFMQKFLVAYARWVEAILASPESAAVESAPPQHKADERAQPTVRH